MLDKKLQKNMPNSSNRPLNSAKRSMDMLPASSVSKNRPRQKTYSNDEPARKSFQSPESSPEFYYTQPSAKNTSKKWELLALLFILFLVAGGLFFLWKEVEKTVPEKIVQKQISLPEAKVIEPIQEKPTVENIVPESETEKSDFVDEDKNDFSFAVLGDTQRFDEKNNEGGFQQAVNSIKPKNPSFIVAVGDLLSSCDGATKCEGNLDNWKKVLGDFFAKTYAVMGNHDRTGNEKADALWQKFFSFPENGPDGYKELTYSFDFKDAHFVILNSEKPKENIINTTQRDWLETNLSKNTKKHIFVFFHEPAYPTKSKIDESLDHFPQERDALWKILEKYKVDAVFSGHEHIQSHKKIGTIEQFIFGNTDSFNHELPETKADEFAHIGEGYGIVSVSGNNAKVEFFSVAGDLLKTIPLEK